jgi:hypothetical protein
MVSCPNGPDCNLKSTLTMVAALRIWQSLYCEADWERCERRRLLDLGREVPTALLPDGRKLGSPTRSPPRAA